ncbi:glycosyltransferase family 2 protein [Leifsonia xyli]|uniref:glycosyltransferase family 2 protein n=1 Tax=Leifsonia xyli TaxID=1575 RepID=UPI000693ADBE|nr:glycosyltransferase family 2 protein [Leifsonia xyli]
MTEPLQIVLPMAGLGQRFRATGETRPKPLIEVDGGPMFRKALDSLTAAGIRGEVTAIIRAELQRDHGLGAALRAASPGLRVIELAAPTGGAAETVLAAPLDPERPLLVMDCDIAFESPGYASELARATAGDADGVLLSFPSSDPRYSFAETDDGRVVRTAEKVAISRNALMGVYFFRRAGEFQECAHEVVQAARAGEVAESYLSLVYNRMLSHGSTVRLAQGTFYCFGTPGELASYRETGLPVGVLPRDGGQFC